MSYGTKDTDRSIIEAIKEYLSSQGYEKTLRQLEVLFN